MGYHLMRAAMAQKDLEPTARFILVAIASYADDTTGQCWPSQGKVASDTGYSIGTVNRTIQSLAKAGLLSIEHVNRPRGGWAVSNYKVALNDAMPQTHSGAPNADRAMRLGGGVLAPGAYRAPYIPSEKSLNKSVREKPLRSNLGAQVHENREFQFKIKKAMMGLIQEPEYLQHVDSADVRVIVHPSGKIFITAPVNGIPTPPWMLTHWQTAAEKVLHA